MTSTCNLIDESSEFLKEFKDVKPLKQDNKLHIQQSKVTLAKQLKRQQIEAENNHVRNYLSLEDIEPIDPYDYIMFKQSGIQNGVYKNLRLGKYTINSVINLQNTTFEQARNTVFNKILQSHNNGDRTLLIKHGLGLHSKPFSGFLKSCINKWLRQMPEVIAFHTSLPKHGGNSSVYVLLKKNQQQKANNRELYYSK
ncbi:DNA endonuclease SmrA [Paraglaciecola sp. 2405UD69-4]|uniref:DNA endonuclease SmrA n=1 Tax=Paraglaciecola sp. 2405UD69-4 TaxID=3391836 RepID=UPI0039C9DB24